MGLTGNLRAKSKPGTAAKEEATSRMPETATTPGKGMFIKEFLLDHPRGNVSSVNEAWQAAGFEGSISLSFVNAVRAKMGLTGNLRGKTEKPRMVVTGKKIGRPRKETTGTVYAQPRGSNGVRTSVLDELETDIDRLLFKAMAIGDLGEIEDSLRRARRLLYGASALR